MLRWHMICINFPPKRQQKRYSDAGGDNSERGLGWPGTRDKEQHNAAAVPDF